MPAWLERLGVFASAPDARPATEIAADIEAEIAFHLEERARALEAEGWEPGAARAEAEARFGDIHRVRRQCARIQMGERIMLQRIQVVLTSCLVVAVVLLGLVSWRAQQEVRAQRAANDAQRTALEAQLAATQALVAQLDALAPRAGSELRLVPQVTTSDGALPPGEYLLPDGRASSRETAVDAWRALFAEDAESWRHGLQVAERLAALPGSQGVEILVAVLPKLSSAQREQVAKPFVLRGGHPDALRLLEALADALEPETSVRERAFLYLQTYAWQDLWVGDTTFDSWMARWRDEPVADVLRANADRWAGEVGDLLATHERPWEQLGPLLEVVENVRPETYAAAGLDLGSILERRIDLARLEQVTSEGGRILHERAVVVLGWCRAK